MYWNCFNIVTIPPVRCWSCDNKITYRVPEPTGPVLGTAALTDILYPLIICHLFHRSGAGHVTAKFTHRVPEPTGPVLVTAALTDILYPL